ncbi:MAG: PSD1 domain-containing protein [Cyclobacteriaceae bacterium]
MKKHRRKVGLYISTLMFAIVAVFMLQCKDKDSVPNLPEKVDFNFDVRPILVQNCYLCHGPDPSSRKADLRFDTFEGATALLKDGGHAVVPGSPHKSELVKRITNESLDQVMPPPESNLTLSEYDIAILKKWIDQGAEWKPHWAFIAPKSNVHHDNSSKEAIQVIDDFILKELALKDLAVAGEADKNSLIRRVSYILTGLPPTLEEMDGFLNDESPTAYEKMVDQYLQSERFGERWARHWMDIVRYAETKGHEFDYPIMDAWRYRDYLIRAFNQDLPYDQFVREHLAGDMIESPRLDSETGNNESHIGTAFYTLGEGTHSPVDIRKDEADRIDNMIDVTSKAFQGLTVSCARCHDHKFDPIPTADYYAMYGVMESSRFTPRPAELSMEKLKNLEKAEELKDGIKAMLAESWANDQDLLNTTIAAHFDQRDTSAFEILGDFRGQGHSGWKSDGIAFGKESTLGEPVFDSSGKNIVRLASGKISSKYFSKGIFGALRSPNFTINKDFIGVKAIGEKSTIRIIIDNFQLIRYPIYGGLSNKVEKGEWQQIKFDVSAWKGHKAYIEIIPGNFPTKAILYDLPADAYVEAEYAIAFDGEWPKVFPIKENLQTSDDLIARWKSKELQSQDVEKINALLKEKALKNSFPELNEQRRQLKELTTTLQDSTFFIGVDDGFGVNSPVFVRGSHKTLSEKSVPRGFLSAVSVENNAFNSPGSGRMELADAILDPKNPLTSRVMVNRIWHHLFGRGLVETVDNFGLQGKLPTHPELLDYLAIQFQESGWSIKKIIRSVVLTEAFRRSVDAVENAELLDPDNLLLSHFPLRRLESEAIRDALLVAGGNLDLNMYGPPEKVFLTEFMRGRGRPRESGQLDGGGRRSIYQEVRRNFLQPMMLTFDHPIPFTTFGKRNVTNVPAQSLILMNDPFVIYQAEKMANSVLNQEGLKVDDRIKYIYSKTLSREPKAQELVNAREFLTTLAASYDLTDAEIESSLDVWKDYCHSVLNLKEFIYLI